MCRTEVFMVPEERGGTEVTGPIKVGTPFCGNCGALIKAATAVKAASSPVVMGSTTVMVLKDGRWLCEKCRQAAPK